jgi:glycerol uptake facilitator protein
MKPEAFVAELMGTMILILLGDGVVAGVLLNKSKAFAGGWIVITMAWGLAVFSGVVVAGPYSGAHLNPAVTLGLAIVGKTPWDQVPMYLVAQFLGAFIGATLVFWNLVSEIIGTFVLVFVILTLGKNTESLGPLAVALLIVVIGLSLGGTTGYAINPARDLGPRIMHAVLPIAGKGSSDWEYAWIPVVGPLLGGAVAAVIWMTLYQNFILKVLPN